MSGIVGLSGLNVTLNTLVQLYRRTHSKSANADEFIQYLNHLQYQDGVNLFDVMDNNADNDSIGQNTISTTRYFATGNTVVFQTKSGELVKYDVGSLALTPVDDSEVTDLLDGLDDDSHNSSVDGQIVKDSSLRFGADSITFVQYKLADLDVQTDDNKEEKKLTMSSKDIKGLLTAMAQSLGISDIKEFITKITGNADPKDIEKVKGSIKSELLKKYGGSLDNLLKNLLDVDIEETVSGYIKQAREETLNQIVNKMFNQIVAAYQDNPSYKKGNIDYDFDEIKSVKFDFSAEADVKNEITYDRVKLKSEKFLDYLKSNGVDAKVEDDIKIDRNGNVTLDGVREDKNTQTEDGTGGTFSLSASTVNELLIQLKGKDEQTQRTIIRNKLKEMFGNDPNSALAAILDETLSTSAVGYLQAERDAAFEQVVSKVLEGVNGAYVDNSERIVKEITFDIDTLNGVTLVKANYAGTNSGQKVNAEDLDKPPFIAYINSLAPGNNLTKENITVSADGTVSVEYNVAATNNAPKLSSSTVTESLGGNNFDDITTTTLKMSGADIISLQKQMAQTTNPNDVILTYLRDKGYSETYLEAVLAAVQSYQGTTTSSVSDGVNIDETSYGDLDIVVDTAHRTWQRNSDPIGFEVNGVRYDLVEDEDKDGKKELVGYDDGWSDLTKYDLDKDGDIEGDELDNLMLLVNDGNGTKFVSAREAGVEKIDLNSAQAKDEKDKNGNILAKIFNIIFKGKEVKATQTFDTEEYLDEHYFDVNEDLEKE